MKTDLSSAESSDREAPAFHFDAIPEFNKNFKALKKKYPSLPADINTLRSQLQAAPRTGEPLGSDCFKIRLAITSKNRGKSGGARVITWVRIIDSIIYFLTIYDKSEQDTVSDTALDSLVKQALKIEQERSRL